MSYRVLTPREARSLGVLPEELEKSLPFLEELPLLEKSGGTTRLSYDKQFQYCLLRRNGYPQKTAYKEALKYTKGLSGLGVEPYSAPP